MKSIIQQENVCFFCGTTRDLQTHHCLHGTANRKLADKYGLTVRLCRKHHEEAHREKTTDRILQVRAQIAWEEHYGNRSDFMAVFGRDYLWQGNDTDELRNEQNDPDVQAREASK